jgi:hypothetical protein
MPAVVQNHLGHEMVVISKPSPLALHSGIATFGVARSNHRCKAVATYRYNAEDATFVLMLLLFLFELQSAIIINQYEASIITYHIPIPSSQFALTLTLHTPTPTPMHVQVSLYGLPCCPFGHDSDIDIDYVSVFNINTCSQYSI